MKKTALLFCFTAYLSLCLAQVKDPVIMNIGGKDVTKSEFEYIWNKNNTNNTADKKSLDEYLDLFVNLSLNLDKHYLFLYIGQNNKNRLHKQLNHNKF